MNFIDCENYTTLSRRAGSLVISEIQSNRNLLLCAASGNSPTGLYRELARRADADRALFAELRIIKLDEWLGIPGDDVGSGESYLRMHVLEPLRIPAARYISFASTPADPSRECERIRSELAHSGPIDVCVLGLGVNGHIGFNEPGPFVTPHCHVARLSEESRRHSMVRSRTAKPHFGLTLGMQEILESSRIILLVAGEGKHDALARLTSREVTTSCPASLLWLHRNVDCLIDRSVLS